MARIKDSSVEAVKAAADIVAARRGLRRLRKAGGRYTGLCPFHQERTPSFSCQPARGTFNCFGCGEGGDAITFVERSSRLDFVGAIEWLGDRFNVQLEYEESSPEADASAAARAARRSCSSARRRSTSASSGTASRARSRATTSRRAASARRSAASSGSARARRADAHARGAREGLHAATSCSPPASSTGAATTTSRAGCSSRSPTRAGACAASRRASSTRTTRCGRSTSTRRRASSSGRATCSTGSTARAQPIAKQDRAVVVEGNTDVLALRQAGLRAGRRVDGHRAHRAAAPGARPADEAALPLLRRRRRGPGRDAARDGARRQAGLRRPGRLAARRAPIPADDPAAFEQRLAGAGQLSRAPRPARDRARARPAAPRSRASRRSSTRSPTRPSTRTRGGSRPTCSTCRPRRRPRSRRARALESPRRRSRRALLDAGRAARAERARRRRRAPEARRATSRSSAPSTSTRAPPARAGAPARARGGGRRADAARSPSSTRCARPRSIDEETAEQLLLRLRERRLQRELADARADRFLELQQRARARSGPRSASSPRPRLQSAAPIPGSSIGRASGC